MQYLMSYIESNFNQSLISQNVWQLDLQGEDNDVMTWELEKADHQGAPLPLIVPRPMTSIW